MPTAGGQEQAVSGDAQRVRRRDPVRAGDAETQLAQLARRPCTRPRRRADRLRVPVTMANGERPNAATSRRPQQSHRHRGGEPHPPDEPELLCTGPDDEIDELADRNRAESRRNGERGEAAARRAPRGRQARHADARKIRDDEDHHRRPGPRPVDARLVAIGGQGVEDDVRQRERWRALRTGADLATAASAGRCATSNTALISAERVMPVSIAERKAASAVVKLPKLFSSSILRTPPSRPRTRSDHPQGQPWPLDARSSAPPRSCARPQFESLSEPPEMLKQGIFWLCTEGGVLSPRDSLANPTSTNLTKFTANLEEMRQKAH